MKKKNLKNNKKAQFYKAGKGKRAISYLNKAIAYDVETSSFYNENNEKTALVYSHAVCIDGTVHIFRHWEEFKNFLKTEIVEKYGLTMEDIRKRKMAIIYVHNLSYEYQFMKKFFTWDEVKPNTQTRKIMYARTTDGIEFRCSYMLTQKSLATLAEETPYKKMVGDLDYEKIRTPETPLTDEELRYIRNDVLSLEYFITDQIGKEGNITKIPYTKTGYVRRHMRELVQKDAEDYQKVQSLTLKPEEFEALRKTFMGGYVHANYMHVDKVLEGVASYDFTSSYPARMIENRFPMATAVKTNIDTLEDYDEYVKDYCIMSEIELTHIQAHTFASYLSQSKCTNLLGEVIDNGRVYQAEKLTCWVTDVDLEIIRNTYKIGKIEFIRPSYLYAKDYLPASFLKGVLDLYRDKTTLKGVEGREEEYQLKKGMLNSTYGMCVSNPIHEEWKEHEGDLEKIPLTYEQSAKKLEKENESPKRFLFYPWGVWITAYARRELMRAITAIDEDWVYSDTDSVKLLNYEKYAPIFTRMDEYNRVKMETACKVRGLNFADTNPKDIKGQTHQLGAWDFEGVYEKFKTLGCKRYLAQKGTRKCREWNEEHKRAIELGIEEEKIPLVLTNSGINKKQGSKYLWDTGEPFEIYTHSMTIPSKYSGRLVSTFIDEPRTGTVTDYLGNSHNYAAPSGLFMEKSTYSMLTDAVYMKFLDMMQKEHANYGNFKKEGTNAL